MNKLHMIMALTMTAGLVACAHSESKSSDTAASADNKAAPTATKESKSAAAIRKRAAFDLGCEAAAIQVTEMESENFVRPATFGAVCGEKRASYIYRMGTIIKN